MNLKSKQLVYELKNISKGENTIYKYLARIERIVYVLDSIEDMISHRDQLEAILDGFIDEYNALASIIQYPIVIWPIIEAEYMLLSHESKIDKIKKIVIYESMFINLTQDNIFAHESVPQLALTSDYAPSHQSENQFTGGSQLNGGNRVTMVVTTLIVVKEVVLQDALKFSAKFDLNQYMMLYILPQTLIHDTYDEFTMEWQGS